MPGKLYQAPEVSGEMQGIGNNSDFSDVDIAQVLSFIRSSWTNKAGVIKPVDVTQTRKKYSGRQTILTPTELDKLEK